MNPTIDRTIRRRLDDLLEEIMTCEEPVFTQAQVDHLEKRFFELLEWLNGDAPEQKPLHSSWHVQFSPWHMDDKEIPAFEIYQEDGEKLFDTNEHLNPEVQERAASLAAAAPELRIQLVECLRLLSDYDEMPGEEGDTYRSSTQLLRRLNSSIQPNQGESSC